MERRDFLKISVASGAVTALEGCGNPDHQLIRFVPEEVIFPGIATWKPGICTLCPAGCGMIVRVMLGDAEVIRKGQSGIIRMGLAKKLEGNPAHPISRGKLCPRGQAGLQVTYHPDRVKNPMLRTGPRGSGQFQEIGWDDAIMKLVTGLAGPAPSRDQGSIAFITTPLRGQRNEILTRFLGTFKNSALHEFAFFDASILRHANFLSFHRDALPTVDFAHSNYVISFGADFLGTWNSPVAQSAAFGQMRKGRPGQRGKLVHVEPRMSLTAASADEWVPAKPGMEGVFALSLANVILREKLVPAAAAAHSASLISGWSDGLPNYAPDKIAVQLGVPPSTISRIAREAAANSPAVALIGDTGTAHTNGLFNAIAVNALNALLGSVDKPGGITFTPAARPAQSLPKSETENSTPSVQSLAELILSGSGADIPKTLLLYNANPVFATPPSWRVREALAKIPFIASFGNFIDDTSLLSDLILPDHAPIESWLDDVPESGAAVAVSSLASPAVKPLHNTRSMPDVLLDVAHQLGGAASAALPWKTYEDSLRAAFLGPPSQKASSAGASAEDLWAKLQAQGGAWDKSDASNSAKNSASAASAAKNATSAVKSTEPQFDGAPDQFPFHFLPFASQMFYDGSLAHLPWMQEAPDPLSSVMWGTWLEINTQTAAKFGIKQGDLVEVASQHGKLQAPAMVIPAIAPDVIAMPVGQGHENFTRYASGRGANPISILAPMKESETGSLAWAATRVKISRISGDGKLILYGGSLVEEPPENKHR